MKLIQMNKHLFVALFFVTLSFQCASSNKHMKKKGDKLVARIEQYRSEHGSLPPNLTELGLVESESGPLYYIRMDSSEYVVYFGYTLGESISYYSSKGRWDDE